MLRSLISKLPTGWQFELKRLHCRYQMARGTFGSPEPEVPIIGDLIGPGDWVIDLGANIGHYTKLFSDLVGHDGRVFAFEPVPRTYSLLVSNTRYFDNQNVTLVNFAASSEFGLVGMSIPDFADGHNNYYRAHLQQDGSDLSVAAIAVDSLGIDNRVSLIKIDVEGHEAAAIRGIEGIITRYRPTLIIETGSDEVIATVVSFGYSTQKLANSPNIIFRPQ